MFEPFFSTKKGPGQGSGMGLAIVYQMLKKMGGDIYIDSEINIGTEVFIRLPINKKTDKKDVLKAKASTEAHSCNAS